MCNTTIATFRSILLLLASLSCHGFYLKPNGIRPVSTTLLRSEPEDKQDLLTVKNYLKDNYSSFSVILDKNDGVWKALGGAEEGGFTIFAPSNEAFQALGAKKKEQLLDPRNLESTQKIAAYHVIAEVVTADQLFNSGGVITLEGEIPVDRSVSGGAFGVGGKEDGGVCVNKAKVTKSIELGSGILHEVDAFVSPTIMWRYMDQLRIPGSN